MCNCYFYSSFKPATNLEILYAHRRDRRKSPGVPGAVNVNTAISVNVVGLKSSQKTRPQCFVGLFFMNNSPFHG